MERYWKDENGEYRINFSLALDMLEIHDLIKPYTEYLSDADIIVEESDRILFVEYKNSNLINAKHPEVFEKNLNEAAKDESKDSNFRKKLAKKFYGTLFTMWACNINNEDKPVYYVLLFESNPGIDARMKKAIIAKMRKQLPFHLKENPQVIREIITDFDILNFEEWNQKFSEFRIEKIDD